jgi:hypothetical protein
MQTVYIGSTLVNDIMLGSQRMDDVFTPPAAITAEFLVVASGNSGGIGQNGNPFRAGAGGGAGGLLSGSLIILPNQSYQIQVGSNDGVNIAYNSYITGSNFYYVATAGGRAGRGGGSSFTLSMNGGNGGSGGGAGTAEDGTVGTAGTGVSGQGNNGGTPGGSNNANAGGGGGAGGNGANGSSGGGGAGGAGKASSISGASVTYSKGGDGGSIATGGGNGVNFGDGGGGEAGDGSPDPGFGKQGVVILRYRGAQKFIGGTVTTDGDFTIHTFTANDPQNAPLFTQYTIVYS